MIKMITKYIGIRLNLLKNILIQGVNDPRMITMIRFTKIQRFIENQKTDKIHSTKEQTSVTVE